MNWAASTGVTIVGSGVDTWGNEAGTDPYRQTSDAVRPGFLSDASGSWVTFNGTDQQMSVASAGTLDYLYASSSGGGSLVCVLRLSATPDTEVGRIYAAKGGIFNRGTELYIQAAGGAGDIRFQFNMGTNPGISHFITSEIFGPTVGVSPSANETFIIAVRLSGEPNRTIDLWANGWKASQVVYSSTSDIASGFSNQIGTNYQAVDFPKMDIAVIAFCNGQITDDQMLEIAAWGRQQYGIVTSASLNP